MLFHEDTKLSTANITKFSITKIILLYMGEILLCIFLGVSQISDHGDLIKNIYSKSQESVTSRNREYSVIS